MAHVVTTLQPVDLGWEKKMTMTRSKLVVAGILALLVLILILQNTAAVETRILFITISMPRAVLLIGTTLVGFIVGILVSVRMAKRD